MSGGGPGSAARRAGFAVMTVLALGVAGYAVVAYGFLPLGAAVHPDMRAAFEANRAALYAHVFGAVFAMALGPLQFVRGLRARRPALHRWTGRLYLGAGVLAGGLSGLVLALNAHGGAAGRAGFTALALAWLFTGLRAFLAIRSGEVAAHRRWMVRNFALTLAAVTLRLLVPAAVIAGLPFAPAYAAIAWACWVPNLVLAEWLFVRPRVALAAEVRA